MIRKASMADLDRIDEIYNEIHDEIESGRAVIGWIRGVYPTRETALDSIRRREMYVMEDAGEIVACARINQNQGPEYDQASWSFPADPDDVLVLHTLVVSPKCKGRGYGTRFVTFYENLARQLGCGTLRIDTNALNAPARSLYRKLGYTEACIIPTEFNGIRDVMLVCLDKPLRCPGVPYFIRKLTLLSQGNLHDIDHFMKVYGWAKVIGEGERLDARTQRTLEIAAVVHDIACPACREQFGSALPHKQEELGAAMTREFLAGSGLDADIAERIAFLVGHHHTTDGVDGMDWQILLEADYIVNAGERGLHWEEIREEACRLFKTDTGRQILEHIYNP